MSKKPGPKPLIKTEEKTGILFMRGIPLSQLESCRQLVTDSLYGNIEIIKKEEMKQICFKTLETCEEPVSGSLNDYFETVYNQVFKTNNQNEK